MDFKASRSRIKRWGLVIGCVLSCAIIIGWADTWDDLRRESAKITSVKAHFTQEKHMQILRKPIISKGLFYYQAPDSVRWEYTSPVKNVLLMCKGSISRFTMGSTGFVEDRGGSAEAMRMVLQQIGRWSKGQFDQDETFSATLKGGKAPKIILTPKEKGFAKMISVIVLDFSAEKPGVIKSIKITENKGNYTLFEFNDVQLNSKINERLFREVE